jgi:hypothetical protein
MAERRDPSEILTDDAGTLTTEWLLVAAGFTIPLLAAVPLLLHVVFMYFYRIIGVISLPFP